MKFKFLTACAACCLLMVSCGNPEPKSLEEAKLSNASDSLSYFLGEQQAFNLSYDSKNDSTLASPEAQKAYYEGLMKAIEIAKSDNEAYNIGLAAGIQFAVGLKDFESQSASFKFNKGAFETGYAYRKANPIPTPDKKMSDMSKNLLDKFVKEAEAANKAEAAKAMAEYAKKNGFTKLNQTLYMKVTKPGQGAVFTKGSAIIFSVSIKALNGKDLSQFVLKDNKVVLGGTLPEEYPYYPAIARMNSGESALVLIPAIDVFGQSTRRIGLKDTDLLLLDITTIADTEAAPAAPEVPAAPEAPEAPATAAKKVANAPVVK